MAPKKKPKPRRTEANPASEPAAAESIRANYRPQDGCLPGKSGWGRNGAVAFISQIPAGLRPEYQAIIVPLGGQLGSKSDPGLVVSRVSPDPTPPVAFGLQVKSS